MTVVVGQKLYTSQIQCLTQQERRVWVKPSAAGRPLCGLPCSIYRIPKDARLQNEGFILSSSCGQASPFLAGDIVSIVHRQLVTCPTRWCNAACREQPSNIYISSFKRKPTAYWSEGCYRLLVHCAVEINVLDLNELLLLLWLFPRYVEVLAGASCGRRELMLFYYCVINGR